MIRLATVDDSKELFSLNEQFNGKGEACLESIRESLLNNSQEIVIVAEENNVLAGFVCVQIKKSFCYLEDYAEITEVYVNENYRRRKLASQMIAFAEEYCMQHYVLYNFEIKTGDSNLAAQALYKSLGYEKEHEILLKKIYHPNPSQ